MSLVAIAGQTFRLRVELESQAAAGTFQSSPTVAAGDVKLLVLPATPAGTETYANSTNAPTVLNGPTAEVILAAAETTAAGDGGEIIAVWADAAGDEWYSLAVHVQVKAADLPDTGDVPTTAQIVAAIDANPPAVNVTEWKGSTAPAMTGDAYARLGAPAGASVSADIAAVKADTAAILEDTGTTLPGLIAAGTGSGAVSFPVTINDEDSNPIDGVEVWISTDSAGASVVAGTLSTDALGVATFMLDAGTYYLWRQKSGYNFANPVTIVVS